MKSFSSYPKNGKQRYNIAGREPWELPQEDVNLPPPPDQPSPPSSVSLLTLLLPPVIMIAGSLISVILMSDGRSIFVVMPMMMMGLGYPIANLVTNRVQKKKYAENMASRQQTYIKQLRQVRTRIEAMIEQQQLIMAAEFPDLNQALAIGMAAGSNKRLWWRRTGDVDFLNLRIGSGGMPLSFKIEPPNALNQKDPLSELPFELLERYEQAAGMPFLVDLKQVGSLVLCGESFRKVIRLARRLLVDILVHHSPEDISLYLLANRANAAEEWEWLKWAPHTHLMDGKRGEQNLLFTTDKINSFLDNLKRLYFKRLEELKNYHGDDRRNFGQSYIVVLDDDRVRQHDDIRRIAADGWQVGIYLIFITQDNVPSTYRARVEIDSADRLDYLETYEVQGSGNRQMGHAELVRKSDVEPLVRTLAGLEVAGGKSNVILPSIVRVVDLIPGDPYSVSEIVDRWRDMTDDSQQVLLPVGQFVDRDGLSSFEIDFRPESIGGLGAYHAMMIGTTGSGKSILMQSMILAAAHRYSPRHINFMFMDFKAGAAELKKVNDLPHSVGMVTDLSPELADRALQALENELSRRKQVFDSAGKISDIWDFNRRFPEQLFPHLVVVIDEFAEGIKILPNLVERLKELGRQGRAFGMYFFLANQEVNSAVDALKANVGWYVLLKVNRQEEMSLIGRNLEVPPGRGSGYIKVKSEVTSIQSAYAGLPANVGDQDEAEINEYVIATFGPDGQRTELFRFDPSRQAAGDGMVQTELELLTTVIKEAAHTMDIPPAQPIYTEPLPALVPINEVLDKNDLYHLFTGLNWERGAGEKNVIPMGFVDIPQRCLQMPFSLNFNEGGGHLWVIGSPGSGKNLVLLSLAAGLCLTHTPAEINLYALDFGNGLLSGLNSFPHTAAVIRAHEGERIERLLRFLHEELRQRTEGDAQLSEKPEIYLLIHNVADFRQQYPDQAEELGRFVRSGGAVGIHIVISANRGSELPRSLSGNIMNRIVLQLTEKQEYMDVLNTVVPPLTMRTQGRGYLLSDGDVAECQVAFPTRELIEGISQDDQLSSKPETIAPEMLIEGVQVIIRELGTQMRSAWNGALPNEIHAMQKELPLAEFELALAGSAHALSGLTLPFGLDFENLTPIILDAREEGHFWTVLGPRQCGKSTLMTSLVYFLRKNMPGACKITLMPFRRGPLTRLPDEDHVTIETDHTRMIETINAYYEEILAQPDLLHILLMDDLGTAFAGGNQAILEALNTLGDRLAMAAQDNFLIMIADQLSNLKTPQTYSSSFLKLFQQNQVGIFYSMDDGDMQWFNTRIGLHQRKSLKLLPGRGFIVAKGKADFFQTPLVTPESFHNVD